MKLIFITLLLLLTSAHAADLTSVSTSTDANGIVTFTMQYASPPELTQVGTGAPGADSFRITMYDQGIATSILKEDEIVYGYGLPIHYLDDPEPLVPGKWKGAIRFNLQPPPMNTFSYSASLGLLGVGPSFTYKVEPKLNGQLVASYGCQSNMTCLPTSAVVNSPPPALPPVVQAPPPPVQPAPVVQSCQSGLALWFAKEESMNKKLVGIILSLSSIVFTNCSSGGNGDAPAPSATLPASAQETSYVVKFKSGDLSCVMQNANLNGVKVYREEANGTLTDVSLPACQN